MSREIFSATQGKRSPRGARRAAAWNAMVWRVSYLGGVWGVFARCVGGMLWCCYGWRVDHAVDWLCEKKFPKRKLIGYVKESQVKLFERSFPHINA